MESDNEKIRLLNIPKDELEKIAQSKTLTLPSPYIGGTDLLARLKQALANDTPENQPIRDELERIRKEVEKAASILAESGKTGSPGTVIHLSSEGGEVVLAENQVAASGLNGSNEAGPTEDDRLRAELERLFPNPKTLAKTRKILFEIVKLKRTSPNLTREQLAGQLGIGEETIKRNLKMLRGHNLF